MQGRIALPAAILVACGGVESKAPSNPAGAGEAGGQAPITALKASTTQVKVVTKTTKVVSVEVEDDSGGRVSCTSDAACSSYDRATCQNGYCTMAVPIYGVFYILNFNKGDRSNIPLPCDGNAYTVEVYGAANLDGIQNNIQEVWVSGEIVPPVSDTACTIPETGWTAVASPSFSFPTIYVGLPAPYDMYTVGIEGLRYPWTSRSWSSACAGASPVSTTATSATFNSPTSPGTFTCQGLFSLDTSALKSGEAPWIFAYTSPAQRPVPSGGGGFP